MDVNTLEDAGGATGSTLNEIAFCNLSTAQRVPFDPYEENRATGAFILVDRFTNRPPAPAWSPFALRRATNIHHEDFLVTRRRAPRSIHQKPVMLWFTGLSGSGKSTIAKLVEQELHRAGRHTYMLDGDNLRHGLNRDLGFTDEDRVENIRRVGEVAKLFVDAGLIVLCSFISPFRAERQMVRELVEPGRVRRGLRRHADRGMHPARPEGPLRQGEGRRDHRTSPASTARTRRRTIRTSS